MISKGAQLGDLSEDILAHRFVFPILAKLLELLPSLMDLGFDQFDDSIHRLRYPAQVWAESEPTHQLVNMKGASTVSPWDSRRTRNHGEALRQDPAVRDAMCEAHDQVQVLRLPTCQCNNQTS